MFENWYTCDGMLTSSEPSTDGTSSFVCKGMCCRPRAVERDAIEGT